MKQRRKERVIVVGDSPELFSTKVVYLCNGRPFNSNSVSKVHAKVCCNEVPLREDATRTNNNPIAIIWGLGGYNDLGLIRSCGEAGMDVICIHPEKIVVPIYKSRYIIRHFAIDCSSGLECLDIVKTIHENFSDKDIVIFPASDLCACIIDDMRELFSKYAIIPGANGNVRKLMDKGFMVQLAQQCGLNVPNSIRVDLSKNELPTFKGPCIIKPLRSISGEKSDITICRDSNTFIEVCSKYEKKESNDILIQELIDGANQQEVAITGISSENGQVETFGIIRKTRIRGNGSTVFAKYMPFCDSKLKESIINFIRMSGYVGIFDMEFLHNQNGYNFIECNFRNGAYGYAITRAGFNMPLRFYKGMLGKPLPSPQIKEIVFMEERSDILHVFEHSLTLKEWLRDFISSDTLLWWNWKDPKPLFRVPYFIKKYFG